jgi:GNAT superfamily N-acetyltransferase
MIELSKFTLEEKPELRAELEQINSTVWPEFLLHMEMKHAEALFTTFAEFQLLLCNPSGELIAFSLAVPLKWDDTPGDLPRNISEIMQRALDANQRAAEANTLAVFAAVVNEGYQGQGLSSTLLKEVKRLAAANGFTALIVPVRPTWKNRYPLTPMSRYASWTRADGAPLDPWLRVHWRLGGKILRVEPSARTVNGTVMEWEKWTGMSFPESGEYIVPGALQPVSIDREQNIGMYEDPSVWVKHPVSAED